MNKGKVGYRGKLIFIVVGLAIGIASLMYSNQLAADLRQKERREIGLWAYAVGVGLRSVDLNEEGRLLIQRIIEFSEEIPVLVVDDNLRVIESRNIPPATLADPGRLRDRLERMGAPERMPITIIRADGNTIRIYYDESPLLKGLRYFPWIQLGVFGIFIGFAFITFRSSKHSEQNRVWIGMAKETAHQLGTPTSSLLGWLEYLRSQPIESFVVDEMNKDLTRLLKVVDRFSKIGSATNLSPRNIHQIVSGAVTYFRTRIPKNVTLTFDENSDHPMQGMVNEALFEWVIENLLKNALDALQGRGNIAVEVSERDRWIGIDVRDTGKGIPKNNFKRIFDPGFSTKTRGWGLGLSLSKRIVEEYHHGRIFVAESEMDKGTTMRIMIRKL